MKHYHLSFNKDLPEILYPRAVAGSDTVSKNPKEPVYTEPETPRICFSKTLAGCFMAFYPNISQYFEMNDKAYPSVDFWAYVTEDPNVDVATDVLTKKLMVWDAHVTGEVWYTHPVKIKRLGKIRFTNTAGEHESGHVFAHPFGNTALPLKYISPRVEYRALF